MSIDPAGGAAEGAAAPRRFSGRRPLWDEVSANKRNSLLLLVAVGALLGVMAWLFGELTQAGPAASALAILLAAAGAFSSYWYSDRIVLSVSGARPIDPAVHPQVINILEGLALAAGLPAPRAYLIEDSAPNAFATGRDPRHAAVVVTSGLLQKLNRAELEGVLAHEMSHVANYDIRMTTLAGVLVGSVALLSDWMLRTLRWGMWSGRGGSGRRGRGSDGGGQVVIMLLALVFALLAPLAAQALRFALSRRREFLADANGALLTRYPEGLASALEKIAADTEPLEVANRATAPLYIVNPLRDYKESRAGLFDTHPPIEERIRRLRSL